MSGYLVTKAQKERILASLHSIRFLANSVSEDLDLDEENFDPTSFNESVQNIVNEAAFVQEYVNHNFLSSKASLESTNQT